MGMDHGARGSYPDRHQSDTEITESERTANSGRLSGPLNKRAGTKTAGFNMPYSSTADNIGTSSKSNIVVQESYVDVDMDHHDDSVATQSVKNAAVASDLEQDTQSTFLTARGLDTRTPFGSSVVRSVSAQIRQVSQELKRLTSFSKERPPARIDRTKSAAGHALTGLKFISERDGSDAGWPAVEKQFNKLTASTNGYLPRSLFGKCIGREQPHAFFLIFIFGPVNERN